MRLAASCRPYHAGLIAWHSPSIFEIELLHIPEDIRLQNSGMELPKEFFALAGASRHSMEAEIDRLIEEQMSARTFDAKNYMIARKDLARISP